MLEELDILKQKLLDMFKWFHSFCTENGLKYYALGGTALGMARHGGFIPWDDDIDVGMPREDYEKLKLLSGGTDGKYIFEFPGNAKDFVYPFAKLYDTETTLIENRRYKPRRGIYIDIFPLDSIGDTEEDAVSNFTQIDSLVNLFETKACAIRRGRKLYKNLAIIAMRCIPDFIIGRKKILQKIDTKLADLCNNECKYIANCFGCWHEKEISERAWFGEPVLYDFEDMKIYGPQNTDAYLSRMYGDWRTPPPKEKQVTHHDYLFLDLNEPYKK